MGPYNEDGIVEHQWSGHYVNMDALQCASTTLSICSTAGDPE
jgi:hypothetical protein